MLGNSIPSQESLKSKLLIVDDEPDICSALGNLLRSEGYSVQEAFSGQQALDLLEQTAYDVMLLDIRMPGMDGLAVMRHTGQMYADLRIIILTGHAALENAIEAAKSAQVVDYLIKPAKKQILIEAVEKALQKRTEQLRQRRLVEAARQVLDAVHDPKTSPERGTASPISFSPPGFEASSPQRFIHCAPLSLDRTKQSVTLDHQPNRPIELTKGETAVLASLMAVPNQTLSCREIVFVAWGYDIDEVEAVSVVRPYVSRLRRKIAAIVKAPALIRTVRGCGYYFAPSEE